MADMASSPHRAGPRLSTVPAGTRPRGRSAGHDPRWPRVADALERLRLRGRGSVRIVDIDCGAGTLLLHALRHARSLGFVAIEGCGIGGAPAVADRARASAARAPDPAIGVEFEAVDIVEALERESEMPADIVLWHGSRERERADDMAGRLRRAGNLVIGDDEARERPARLT